MTRAERLKRTRPRETPWGTYLVRTLIVLLCVSALCVCGFIIYFNGDNARAPLLKLISSRSGLDVTAERMEFSPIYPDVIKLDNVTIGKGHIDQLYVEYDIKPLLQDNQLIIRDLYARGVRINDEDFGKFKQDRLGFAVISAAKVRLEETALEMDRLSSAAASLTLSNLKLGSDGRLTVPAGHISAADISADGFKLRNLNSEFAFTAQGLVLRNITAECLGGSVAAGEVFVSDKDVLRVNNMVARNLVLREPQDILGKRRLEVAKAEIENVVAVFDTSDLMLGQISGRVLGLKAGGEGGAAVFEGTVGEISFPDTQITLDENKVEFAYSANRASFKASGNLADGTYALDMELNYTDRELRIRNLALKNNRLEPDDKQAGTLISALDGWTVNVAGISAEEVALISHMSAWPVSVRELSGSGQDLNITAGRQLGRLRQGAFNCEASGLFYSDLGFSRVKIQGEMTDGTFTLAFPEIQMQRSKLSASLAYNLQGLGASLKAEAHDLDLAELNCNLFPHVMSGYVNLNANLTARGEYPDLWQGMEGEVVLSGQNLIVSAFGLDLINGGGMQSWNTGLGDLLEAMKSSDCGAGHFNLRLAMHAPHIGVTGNAELTSSTMDVQADIDMHDKTVAGNMQFVSLPGDSSTDVALSGTAGDVKLNIIPRTRGEARPGLRDLPNDESQDVNEFGFDDEPGTAKGPADTPSAVQKAIEHLLDQGAAQGDGAEETAMQP